MGGANSILKILIDFLTILKHRRMLSEDLFLRISYVSETFPKITKDFQKNKQTGLLPLVKSQEEQKFENP